jgi:RNA polymerase sigma-70 factor (ECF subfamily)
MPLVEQNFEDQYEQHYRRVFDLCRYLLNSFDAAEDATHEVFVRAYQKKATYDASRPVLNWLLGIARHYCIDILRRRAKDKRLFSPAISESFDPPSSEPGPRSTPVGRGRQRST